jgi:hypothetical protein
MEIAEAEEITKEGIGIYSDEYHEALELLRIEHQNDPCPDKFKKREIFEYDGVECLVYYNYVPPYRYSIMPMNAWRFYSDLGDGLSWGGSLSQTIETIEDACNHLRPLFEIIVDKHKEDLIGH